MATAVAVCSSNAQLQRTAAVSSPVNRLRIDATLVAKSETRYTPAGLAVQEVQLQFVGAVQEADVERSLDFEFDAVAVGSIALQLSRESLGTALQLDGFVAPRSKRSHRLRIHVTQYQRDSQRDSQHDSRQRDSAA